jgi:hypothetical protein
METAQLHGYHSNTGNYTHYYIQYILWEQDPSTITLEHTPELLGENPSTEDISYLKGPRVFLLPAHTHSLIDYAGSHLSV